MPDTMPTTVTRPISVEFPHAEFKLPPCPDGWKPVPEIEYDEDLVVSVVHETTGTYVNWRKFGDDIYSSLEHTSLPQREVDALALGLDEAKWEALHAYGQVLWERVDLDCYYLATASLDAFRDIVTTRATERPADEDDPLVQLVKIAEAASDGDSNDAEIAALREALSTALERLGWADIYLP